MAKLDHDHPVCATQNLTRARSSFLAFSSRIAAAAMAFLLMAGLGDGVSRPAQAAGNTITAASCSRDHVNTALGQAAAGDTVQIPAGSCAWTSGITFNPPPNVTVRGAGTSVTGGGNQTVITDNYAANAKLLEINVPATGIFRLEGITFQSGTGTVKDGGTIRLNGPGLIRIGHVTLNATSSANYKMVAIGSGVFGVMYESILNFTSTNAIYLYNGRSGGNGDGSANYEWTQPTNFGSSDHYFYLEDNIINGKSNGSTYDIRVFDGFTGAKVAVRFNTVSQAVLGETHATGHAPDDRGLRSQEIYGNLVTSSLAKYPNYVMLDIQSGTTLAWGNDASNGGQGVYKNMFNIKVVRANNATYSQSATPKGWGYCGTEFNGSGSNWDGGTALGTNAVYGYPCLDQPGRGAGDLLVGLLPNTTNATTGTIRWPNQALEPIYIWSNKGNIVPGWGGSYYNVGSSQRIQANRDYYPQASGVQTSPSSPFNGTSGTGWGTLANRPTTCTPGVGYFATDQGSWNTSSSNPYGVQFNGAGGVLYKCTATNTWTLYYTPLTYPHPLRTASVTPPPTDTSAPSAPANLAASAASTTQINLAWTASTDNVGVTGYRVERCSGSTCTNFSQIATPSGTSFSDTGLSVNTTYRYRVRATDAAGNLSGYSSIAGATTPSQTADTTAPSVPGSLSASAASTSQINLTWSASTDNVGVSGYRLERCSGSSCTNFSQIATPSGTSFSNTGLSENTTYRYRVRATDAAGNLSGYSSIAGATTPQATGGSTPLPQGQNGIAAKYQGDASIGSDPNVLFADDFESYSSSSQLTSKWTSYWQSAYTRIATETGNVFAGNRALEFTLPQTSSEAGNAVIKTISPTQDRLFVRVYTKFDAAYQGTTEGHNGITISSNYPGPGQIPDGTDFFYFSLENSIYYNENEPGYTNVYAYHPDQRGQWGDHWYPDGTVLPIDATPGDFGPYFVARPNFIPDRNKWYSYEMMLQANTPGARDGRVAVWIDGNLVADFQNVRVRDISNLKIDQIALALHGKNSARVNKKWYDNVVVARSYIGPMATGIPPVTDTTAPSIPTSLAASVASITQINLTWAASTDNVGVTGYRVERCSGSSCSNFSQIATPIGTSFSDTGLSANTAYRYRVRATDAAGNLSGYSSVANATMQDTTAPSVPGSLSAAAASTSQISVTWSASTDNVGVTGYRLERCSGSNCTNFSEIATQSGISFSNTGLSANTTYRYRVRATDAAGNLSGYSSIAGATTQSVSEPPVAIKENIWGSRSTSSYGADGQPWDLGMVFIPTADGQVTGVRVFGQTGESGNHTARLWRNSDNKLLSGPLTISYSGSGWKEFMLPTPVPLVANQAYTVSVSTGQDSSRRYTEIPKDPTMGTGGNNGKSLTYPANAAVYSATIGVRPTQSWQQSNYLRDVIFVPNQTTSGAGVNLASEEFQAKAAAEPTATAEVNGDWTFVEVPSGLVNPVVIAGPPSFNDGEPGVARVRYANDEGFEFRFQEWDYLDGSHSNESIPYLVLEPGRHVMIDGSIWEVGTFALGGTNSWKSVKFSESFGRAPYLFLTVQTENDLKAVTVRARSVGRSGFQAALFEEEAQNREHATETVGYLAIYSNGGSGGGEVDLDGTILAYQLRSLSVNATWTPVLGHQLKLEEEQSKDLEVEHTHETVHVLTLGQQLFSQQVSTNSVDTTAPRRQSPE